MPNKLLIHRKQTVARNVLSVLGIGILHSAFNILLATCIFRLLYVQHGHINKIRPVTRMCDTRVFPTLIFFLLFYLFFFAFLSVRLEHWRKPVAGLTGCQHLTDLIISIFASCRTVLRVAAGIPNASCPIVMRKYGICVTIKCASHLCYPHLRALPVPQPQPQAQAQAQPTSLST